MTQRPIREAELGFVAAASVGRLPAPGDVPAGLDWGRVRQLAARHRVEGLIWHAIEQFGHGRVPEGVAESLRGAVRDRAFDYLGLLAETVRLSRLLDARELPAIVLKGSPLAVELFGNQPQLRHAIDIDLLVAPEAFELACALIEAQGYVRTTPAEGVKGRY